MERNLEAIKEALYLRRVVEWDEGKLVLDNGQEVSIICSDHDCCAWAGGTFDKVKLDAVITDVKFEVIRDGEYACDTYVSEGTLMLYHNRNEIAQGLVYADAGNGGYYYSVAAIKIGLDSFDVLHA